ncbi:hypothetical protein [Undibacterium sp. Di24W]|uniref:hypothetical protein n=1 Tax=Undibacterium sp. Di24W TaxID=3413033 RepID=UPI003BF0B58F
MELIELANKAHALINKLEDLRKILTSILDTDAKVALARGYSPVSLDIGPLKQWIYVIDTHLAAKPLESTSTSGKSDIQTSAVYFCYLIDHIQSDTRFVGEMQLSWSRLWVQKAEPLWQTCVDETQLLITSAPRPNRERFMVQALTAYHNQRTTKD